MSTTSAEEIWAAAQLAPGEGIEDGVKRIARLIKRDAKDAARYRWLRDYHDDQEDGVDTDLPHIAAGENHPTNWALTGKEADQAIDRERKRKERKP